MKNINVKCALYVAVSALLVMGLGAADWLTFAGNPQRTGWAQKETAISPQNVGKLRLEWSLKLDNQAKELNGLMTPLIVENAITPKGFKDIVLIAGAGDTLFAIDADTHKIIWQRQFAVEAKPKQEGRWLCPNALNATPVVDTSTRSIYMMTSDGKLHTLNYINGEDQKPTIEFTAPFAKVWSLNIFRNVLYTTTSQGCGGVRSAVYTMHLADPDRTIEKAQVGPAGGAGIWGRAGVAISSVTGLAYAETGDGTYDPAANKFSDTIVGVSPDGKVADYYTPSNRAWISKKDLDMGNISPVVFPFKDWELVAGSGKEGVIYLLDAKQLGGADHRTPLFRSPLYTNEKDEPDFAGRGFWGSLSTYADEKGTRWLYAPAYGAPFAEAPKFPVTYGPAPAGSIMAFKVDVKDNKPVLVPGWMSRDMSVPEPPIIANGVVFALSNGENVRQVDSGGRIYTSKERADTPSGNATLYAFDAETGKELYSSGKTIPGFTHFSGLSISNGRVYVVTHDSTVWVFGLEQ